MPCLTPTVAAQATGFGRVDGIHATVCFGGKCLLLDRNGSSLGDALDVEAETEAWRKAREVASVNVTVEGQVATACVGAHRTCASVTLAAVPLVTAASATLKRLTAFDHDFIDTFDLKTGELLWHLPATEVTRAAKDARYVGDTRVLVLVDQAQWELLDITSGALTEAGERGAQVVPTHETIVAAFAAQRLSVIDADRMKPAAKFTLPGVVADAMPWFDRIFVVLDHPAGTAQIDPKTATVYAGPPLPLCR